MRGTDFQRVFALPFAEAERFFRDKLSLPTETWRDLEGAAHAKAFTSAGAYQAELLAELRQMTDRAIAGGMDIREFRQQFRPLLSRYGWQLQGGGAAWRSDLIWRTNINTAYQAGRWQQFEEGGIKHLKYVHNDRVRHPRPAHVAMDGIILPKDDPFWSANYPPNGWGCKCRAVAVADKEAENAPAASKIRPEGWETMADRAWRYNVGEKGAEKGYAALTEKFETLPNDVARAWMARFVREPAFTRFVEGKIAGEFPVAVMRGADMAALGSKSQTVWLSAESLAKNKGELPTRSAGYPELTVDEYRLLPQIVDEGEVYRQSDQRLIYLRVGEVFYRAALKRTIDGGRNYLLSLFRMKADGKAVRQLEKLERIR